MVPVEACLALIADDAGRGVLVAFALGHLPRLRRCPLLAGWTCRWSPRA